MPTSETTILLAVTGMSPAILTETLWALAHPTDDAEPVIPHRIIAATTTTGRDRLAELFKPSPQLGGVAPWDALRAALQAEGHNLNGRLRFGETADDIRVITAPDPDTGRSRELPDIRNRADNEAAADFLLETVRAIVENPDTRLIASVAGGRKTMGALLYAAMSLLGRETDRVTHVLVNPLFETRRDFFFPAQPAKELPLADGGSLRPADATVELAEVPFVPLRNLFAEKLTRRPGSFHGLVAEASRQISSLHHPPNVTLRLGKRELEFSGQSLSLSDREWVLAHTLLRAAKSSAAPFPDQTHAADACKAVAEELRTQADPNDFSDWRGEIPRNFDADSMRKLIHSLRQKLRSAGAPGLQLDQALESRRRLCWNLKPKLIQLAN